MRYGMILDLNRCYGCQACTIICKQKNGTPPEVFWAKVETKEVGEYPNAHREFKPLMCMHCADAPCIEKCPTGASYKREDGVVLIDETLCIGCNYCIAACPYGARYFDYNEKRSYFPGMPENSYEALQESNKPRVHIVSKCNLCTDRLAEGDIPACAQVCPTKARIFDTVDSIEFQKKLIERNGYQDKAELGTDPSVYYLPRK